ncbi:MAG: urease accessory protein UreD [Methylobacterium sp.]|uniref:urease accessory protein UreD n=1 Tax=Methylobacterium sp. TaxID=409 RepID=UPI002720AD03|nr:urease accessory protein UreD [Methylobacterium sp.]MDO9428719.1 urease accessory protein UreD [Methylobacterium sp.]
MPPTRQRSDGRVHLRVGRMGADTRILDIAESGPLRVRLPRGPAGPCEAVLLNSAGGIACGDRFTVSVAVGAGAGLVLTTTAAEKVYRSDGPGTVIETTAAVAAGGHLAFLPQETILFDGVSLRRSLTVDLAGDAGLLAFEAVTFGRVARGERIRDGRFHDHWRIRCDGRLAYADSVRLDGAIADALTRAAIGGDARAMATLVDVSPGAEGRLETMRALLEAGARDGVGAAASAWNGHLVVRFLGADPAALRALAQAVLVGYRGVPLPRVWQA